MLEGLNNDVEFPSIGYRRVVDLESIDVELRLSIERDLNDVKIDGESASAGEVLQHIQKTQRKLRQLFLVLESMKWRIEDEGVPLGITQSCENSRNRERVNNASGIWGKLSGPIPTEADPNGVPLLPQDYVGPRSEFVLDLGMVSSPRISHMAKELPKFLFVVFTKEGWSEGRAYVEFEPHLVPEGSLDSKSRFVRTENILTIYF